MTPHAVFQDSAFLPPDCGVSHAFGGRHSTPLAGTLTAPQVHGTQCLVLPGNPQSPLPPADALVTRHAGLPLGILTADCAPVLFYARHAKDGTPIVGAAHAGWRGALAGVLDTAVREILALGGTQESLRAVIGPCIGRGSYEVQERFADPFILQNPENERYFSGSTNPDHLMFDLAGYCAGRLAAIGMAYVGITGQDTCTRPQDFYSHRRGTRTGKPETGRQISTIVIDP